MITWRELGYIFCHRNPNTYNQYAGLPEWALKTLDDHASDPREFVYSLDQLDHAETHDELWNAAQTQLREEGYIHNYMRMLWGKKILEWTPSPEHAFEILVELNNRYAIDGRNPNSWSGLCWTLGRFDRPWGPRAQGVWQDSLHEQLEYRQKTARKGLFGAVRWPGHAGAAFFSSMNRLHDN